jgi:Trk K+ transport system NAD-binding subunit
LTNRGQHAVVVDIDETRTNIIALQNLRDFVPTLHGDVRRPEHLLAAGLTHRLCAGVVALTNDNSANLKVAITAKLLRAQLNVICRADSLEIEANMASFGTDYIVDPFDTFATHLAMALHSPCLYLLHRWLTSPEEAELDEPVYPPRDGHWIVCGYGRFGRAICERLKRAGINPMVIEANPTSARLPTGKFVRGWGTEADTLLAAGVDRAVGLVAGTDDDANNLSIVMTARDLNRKLFVIVRQNNMANEQIVQSSGADMVMHPSTIIADKIRVLLATPYLYEFFKQAQYQDDSWACQLAARIAAVATTRTPVVRTYSIDAEDAAAVYAHLCESGSVCISDLLHDPWNPEHPLCCVALMLAQGTDRRLLPPGDTLLKPGDTLLFCGRPAAFTRLEWMLRHPHTLNLVCARDQAADGWLWRLMRPRRLKDMQPW